jgi:outer membrane protein OmpA-like peptidoglycan-associated protein
MSSNLLDTLTGLVTPDVVSAASRQLGDSESAISTGLGASFASILLGLVAKSGSPEALRPAFDLITNPANDGSALDDPRQLLSASPTSPVASLGGTFLSSIFGTRLPTITNAVGNTVGLRGSSAASLLNMAAPLVMGLLGKRVRKARLDPTGLSDLLAGQRDGILAAAPAGVSSALGIGEIPRLSAQRVVMEPPRESSGRRWLWPALAALALIAVLWSLTRHPSATSQVAALDPAGAVTGAVTAVSDAAGELGAFVKRKLPGGLEINVPERGTESNLIAFIEDPTRPVDETTWFDFDRLNFETGSAELQATSREQLLNVAAVLKAYPGVELKIGGYTDNTGAAAANLRLSQARADNVRKELISNGIEPDRLEVEGYGAAHPIADNSTAEGRAKNRRISLRVTEK